MRRNQGVYGAIVASWCDVCTPTKSERVGEIVGGGAKVARCNGAKVATCYVLVNQDNPVWKCRYALGSLL